MTSHCAFGMDMENLAKQSVVVAGNSSQDQQVENDSSEIEGEEGRKLLPETATDSGKITKIFFYICEESDLVIVDSTNVGFVIIF